MSVSTKGKPNKVPKSPLSLHKATGQWYRKIRGKFCYFGTDQEAALRRYLQQKADLEAGRKPRTTTGLQQDGATVRDAINRLLTHKQNLVNSGELTARTFQDYYSASELLVGVVDKNRCISDLDADDFAELRTALSRGVGPVTLADRMRAIRSLFKFAYDSGLVDRPVRYGQSFQLPRRQVMRAARQAADQKYGLRMFEAEELRQLIDAADPVMKSMILLAINAALGPTDLGRLPRNIIDLENGWLSYPRPKTSVERRAWLWPETVEAAGAAMPLRPEPKNEEDYELLYITKYGTSWYKGGRRYVTAPITQAFRKLLDRMELYRRNRGFYAIRKTFATIASECADQVAIDYVMGHTPPATDMASVYRQRISDDRVKRVCSHVRDWLFAPGTSAE